MSDLAIARALHVLAVVIWIGGVVMVTAIVLPAVRRGNFGADPIAVFGAVEGRFSWLARASVLLAGLTGFYMVWRLDMWDRFRQPEFWWMHAMVGVWLIFTLILFVAEPLFAHRRLHAWAAAQPDAAIAWLQRGHWILVALSIATILGAVAGSHGFSIFG